MLSIVSILVAVLGSIAKRTHNRSHASDASIRCCFEPFEMRGQAVGFHEGLDRQSVKDAVARKVHGDARDFSTTAVDPADAG